MNLITTIALASACIDLGTTLAPLPDAAYAVTNDGGSYGPQRSMSSGKVRDTQPKPKARKKDKRSPRHTQRRR